MNALTPTPGTSFTPDADNARALRDAFGKFTTGVTIVTCASADGPICIAANSFSSISLDPPLVMWAVSKTSRRFAYFEAAQHFAIHVLAETQADLCAAASKNAHALRDLAHGQNVVGVPLIDGCLARFDCALHALHEAGDHVIIIGRVMQAEMREGAPLTFFNGDFGPAST